MTESLANFTTMRVGGVPEKLIAVTSTADLFRVATQVWESGDDWLLLGGGSNMVVNDAIESLTVIKVENTGITEIDCGKTVKLRVEAGESWDGLVEYAVNRGLAGIEAMSGIPGTVGASPVQNIGAYGQEVSETITKLGFLDYKTGEQLELENSELGFGYRNSDIKKGRTGVIGWVEFELHKLDGLSVAMASGQITNHLGMPYGSQLPLQQVRDTVLSLRTGKGMVVSDSDPDTHGVGSFFTNPVISEIKALEFPDSMQRWSMPNGQIKLSAGSLIEASGLTKGFSLPGSKAAISNKHALAITNRGGATASDVIELARHIQERVAARFGINLIPEPNLIGF